MTYKSDLIADYLNRNRPGMANDLYASDDSRFVNGTINVNQYNEYLQSDKDDSITRTRLDVPVIEITNSNNIHRIDLFGASKDDEKFWNHHGRSKEDFLELASHIPEVHKRMAAGETLDSLYSDPEVGDCARLYFDKTQMPSVDKYGDTYIAGGDNRHRILAAQEFGYDIPLKVTDVLESPTQKTKLNAEYRYINSSLENEVDCGIE